MRFIPERQEGNTSSGSAVCGESEEKLKGTILSPADLESGNVSGHWSS
jgi:hypothetical protein